MYTVSVKKSKYIYRYICTNIYIHEKQKQQTNEDDDYEDLLK